MVIPTIVLVKDGKVIYHIRGLAEIGGEQCNAEMIGAVLSAFGIIEGEAVTNSEYADAKPQFNSIDEYRAHAIREGFFDQALNADDEIFSDDEYTGDANDA